MVNADGARKMSPKRRKPLTWLALLAGAIGMVAVDSMPAYAQFGISIPGLGGLGNLTRGRSNVTRGRVPNVGRAPTIGRVPNMGNVGRMPGGNIGRGPGNIGRGPADFGRGPGNIGRGPGDFGRGPGNIGRGPGDFGRGPGNIGRGPGDLGRGPGNIGRGPGDFGRGPGNIGRGPGNIGRGPGNIGRGPGNIGRGPGNIGRGPGNIGRGPGDFGRGPGNFGRGPGNFAGRPPGGPGGFGFGGAANFAGAAAAATAAAIAVPAITSIIASSRAEAGVYARDPNYVPGLPMPTERRYQSGEVLFVLKPDAPRETLARVIARYNLRLISEERLDFMGTVVHRYRVPDRQDVPAAIRELTRDEQIAYVQPNYAFDRPDFRFRLQSAASTAASGGSLQYVVDALRLQEAHQMARGSRISIAVIDSGIDASHPEMAGRVVRSFDAVGGPFLAHEHGTGMAGAIVAHAQLTGVSPGADIYAVRAFAPGQAAGASGTSLHILKAMDWAIRNNVRIINMSFAGPRDPMMTRAIQVAAERRITMIAAMGNEGPNAPPSYPAADQNVIAVTATDRNGNLFEAATRGNHVSVAAPGVEVLLPAPQGGYQISSGTSVAAAHVSGIAALILERQPDLDPADLRRILQETARHGATVNPQLGAGVADPVPAINAAANAPAPGSSTPMATAPTPGVRSPERADAQPPQQQPGPRQAIIQPEQAAPRPATTQPGVPVPAPQATSPKATKQ